MMNDIITIDKLIKILKSRVKEMILIIFIIVLVGGYVNYYVLEPSYRVKSNIFNGKNIDENEAGQSELYNNSDVNMYINLMVTYSKILQSRDLIERAINKNNIDISVDEVLDNLDVSNELGTQILEVTLDYKDKKVVTKTLNAIIEEFISYGEELIPNVKISITESPVEPSKPIAPNKIQNMILILIVGVLVSLIFVLIMAILDNKIRYKDDLESLLGIPVVGCISDRKNY